MDSDAINVNTTIYEKILANFTKLENTDFKDNYQCAEDLCRQNECNLGHLLVISDDNLIISDKKISQLQTKEIPFDEFEAIANKIEEFTRKLTRA
uniref:Uncharacterized protein n=1 Tax=viral metagenome TaxID=1070528 RepID=A0A6C0I2G4_9ZZZZ